MDDSRVIIEAIDRIRTHCQSGKLLVGFNSVGFDVPILWHRAMFQDVSLPVPLFKDLTRRFTPKNHFDIMMELAGWDMQRVRGKGLDFWARRLRIGSKGDMDGSMVYPLYLQGRVKEIVEYCLNDVKHTAEVFQRVAPFFYQTVPHFLAFDIETVPDLTLPRDAIPMFDPEGVALGNTKDPVKVAAKIEEAMLEFEVNLPKKMSVDPDLCQVVCVGFYDSATKRATATFMED